MTEMSEPFLNCQTSARILLGVLIAVHRTYMKVCYPLGLASLSTTCGVHKVHWALLVAQTEGLGWCQSPKYLVGVCSKLDSFPRAYTG